MICGGRNHPRIRLEVSSVGEANQTKRKAIPKL